MLSLINGKINYDINDIIVTIINIRVNKSNKVALVTSVNIHFEILLLVT